MPEEIHDSISNLVTLSGLNQIWQKTRELYFKNRAYINSIYTPGEVGHEKEQATGLVAEEIHTIQNQIRGMDLSETSNNSGFVSLVSQEDGKVSAEAKSFVTSSNFYRQGSNSDHRSDDTNAPTCKAVFDFISNINICIKNYTGFEYDSSTVNKTYDPSTNTITLSLPSKVYGAAFN